MKKNNNTKKKRTISICTPIGISGYIIMLGLDMERGLKTTIVSTDQASEAQILAGNALSLTVTEILSDKIKERAVYVYEDVMVGYGKRTENHPCS